MVNGFKFNLSLYTALLIIGFFILGFILGVIALHLEQVCNSELNQKKTAEKVSRIMKLYNCQDPQVHQAIMENFDPVLVALVIAIESEFTTDAISPKGCRGLMQLSPDKLEDWQNVQKNIRVGAQYLKRQLERFDNVELAIAAYNAGPEAVVKYQGVPPFQETIRYLKKFRLLSQKLNYSLIKKT